MQESQITPQSHLIIKLGNLLNRKMHQGNRVDIEYLNEVYEDLELSQEKIMEWINGSDFASILSLCDKIDGLPALPRH